MRERLLSVALLLLGLSLILYGALVIGRHDNEYQIEQNYFCNRTTLDGRSTDNYCSDPVTAPEYKVTYGYNNKFVYAGGAIGLLGIVYLAMDIRKFSDRRT